MQGKIAASTRFLLCIFFSFAAGEGRILAQSATVFGTVNDSLHKPLSGVSVGVYGMPIGMTTDEEGKYSLTVPANQDLKIIFSFTGRRDSVIVKLKVNER